MPTTSCAAPDRLLVGRSGGCDPGRGHRGRPAAGSHRRQRRRLAPDAAAVAARRSDHIRPHARTRRSSRPPYRESSATSKRGVAARPIKRVNTAFAAERSPFDVRLDGNTVRVKTVLEYQGKGWYNAPLGGDLFGSCGLGAARPRAVVEMATTLRITSDWRLRGKSEITRVAPFSDDRRDQCKVTIFKIDVTERVVTAAQAELEKRVVQLDQKIATVDVRTPIERWWKVLQRPIRLSDSVWLLIQPRAVHLGPIAGSGRVVALDVGLMGEPRVVTAPPGRRYRQLPPLKRETGKHEQALHVLLEGELSYEIANAILQKNLVGKRIRRGARWITIREALLSGIGGGRVALGRQIRRRRERSRIPRRHTALRSGDPATVRPRPRLRRQQRGHARPRPRVHASGGRAEPAPDPGPVSGGRPGRARTRAARAGDEPTARAERDAGREGRDR